MKFYPLVEQGSETWFDLRRGVITASTFAAARSTKQVKPGRKAKLDKAGNVIEEAVPEVRGPSSESELLARDIARERVGGSAQDRFQTWEMRQGQEQEQHALIAYEGHTGRLVERLGFAHTEDRRFGCSPDGVILSGIERRGIEIKTLFSSDRLFDVLVDGDITPFRDQIDGNIWLLDLCVLDLVLWVPDLPEAHRLHIVEVPRNDARIEALEADLKAFDARVGQYEAALKQRLGM